MSEIALVFGLLATFGAIALGSLTIGYARGDRRRAAEILRQQVETVSLDMREREMARPLSDRFVAPIVESFGGLARRFTPEDLRQRLDHKLALAGSPAGWDAERVMAIKIAGGVGGVVGGLMLSRMGELGARGVLLTILMTAVGFFGPDGLLAGRGDRRQQEIQRSLPDTMDLLSISVEAGLAYNAALAHVMRHVPGPLSQEIALLLHQMRLGASRMDAMRSLGERTSVPEMKSFVLAMVQAEAFGVSISGVLRAQATDLRDKRRQRAEERAMKIPVKILFPLIFCIMPALFVVIIGPGAIRIAQEFIGIVR